jgi:hypothetical protein
LKECWAVDKVVDYWNGRVLEAEEVSRGNKIAIEPELD